jgi:hypothetical protein
MAGFTLASTRDFRHDTTRTWQFCFVHVVALGAKWLAPGRMTATVISGADRRFTVRAAA